MKKEKEIKVLENQPVKPGDHIILTEARNGLGASWKGPVLTVKQVGKSTFTVTKSGTLSSATIYMDHNSDGWVHASREAIAKIKEDEADLLESSALNQLEQVKRLRNEAISLRKFKTDEEEVAHKLDLLMTAHASAKTKAERLESMTEILTTLKASNLV